MHLNRIDRKWFAVLLAGVLACMSIVSVTPSLARQQTKQEEDDSRAVDDPLTTFRDIELAWQKGNAQAIAALASESPVFVEIRGIDRKGGYFTRPQLFYIMKQMFEGTSQVSFQFVKYRNLQNPDRRIYGVAQRKYRSLRRGGFLEDTVYVTLVKEGSRWVVAEIKSAW